MLSSALARPILLLREAIELQKMKKALQAKVRSSFLSGERHWAAIYLLDLDQKKKERSSAAIAQYRYLGAASVVRLRKVVLSPTHTMMIQRPISLVPTCSHNS